MGRLDLRVNISMPVSISFSESQPRTQNATLANLGLNGAFLKGVPPLERDTKLILHIPAETLKDIPIEARVLRKERGGVAVRFLNHRPLKKRLWMVIRERLTGLEKCPFCGVPLETNSKRCLNCGLTVDFAHDGYLELYESEIRERWIHHLEITTYEHIEAMETLEREIERGEYSHGQIYNRLTSTIDELLRNIEDFENGVSDREIIKKAQIDFRLKTRDIYSKSYFINRARTWPLGYQGDYLTLECIYRNTPMSQGIGLYLDLYALNLPLTVAVRNRIKKLEELLRGEILKRRSPCILNIGCGACRELVGLALDIKKTDANVTCIDNDSEALNFAQNRLHYLGLLPHLDFYRYNALRMFDYELNKRDFGEQDIIYSVGLFDYLPTQFLIKLCNSLYRLLNPGGVLIAAFKDAARYSPHVYHWLVNWDGFIQRTVDDFMYIFKSAGIPPECIKETREDTGIIIFYTIQKV